MKFTRREFFLTAGAAAGAAGSFGRVGDVQIGVCHSSRDLSKAIQFGFDYLEPAAAEIAEMDEPSFRRFRAEVLASPLRCESFNSFIRKLSVVGDDVKKDALADYLASTLERCLQLGGKVVVWGSAGSRNVPDGFSRDRAREQILSFLALAGDFARPKGIVIAIEPLRKQESNIINTGAEALQLVKDAAHPNIQMIIDYYHLREENEDPEIVRTARDHIVHFHFANPHGRVWPKSPDEDAQYGRFFELVKKIGFRGGISIEAKGTFEDDAAASLAFFRRELS